MQVAFAIATGEIPERPNLQVDLQTSQAEKTIDDALWYSCTLSWTKDWTKRPSIEEVSKVRGFHFPPNYAHEGAANPRN
jgi:hypothetical protein